MAGLKTRLKSPNIQKAFKHAKGYFVSRNILKTGQKGELGVFSVKFKYYSLWFRN